MLSSRSTQPLPYYASHLPYFALESNIQGVSHLGGNGRYVWAVEIDVDIDESKPMAKWIVPALPQRR
jgi:hypothetical protein